MRKIDLYIAGQKVDIDEESYVLFNYIREELSNPTIVRNSFSKEITIPGTPANNKLFGHIFKLDRQTTYGDGHRGIEFDAMRKTDFAIYSEDGSILEQGYIRMNNIIKNNNNVVYKVSLYGGLGSFFYSLTYNEDGSKKTLADLVYKTENGSIYPYEDTMAITPEGVKDAWLGLYRDRIFQYPRPGNIYGIINFMPAYNGYPDNFDANKVYYRYDDERNAIINLYNTTSDGYGPHPDGGRGILVEMKNKHTEWEMQDLRSYLQRPIIRLIPMIRAITSTPFGGYQFVIDASCDFMNTSDILHHTWITLKMLDWNKYHDKFVNLPVSALLESTLSPAEYLVSFAKMMGFVFVTDVAAKSVTMMTRDEFFNRRKEDIIDLTTRIDSDTITVSPCSAQNKYYVYQTDNYGEESKKYEETYGIKYGCQVVDTGLEFDVEQKKILQNFAFKGACDVLEKNINYKVLVAEELESGTRYNYFFKFAMTEEVSWKLYKSSGGELIDNTYNPTSIWYTPYGYDYTLNDNDMFPKVQLHGADNKAEDGSNVLVVYNGDHEITKYEQAGGKKVEIQFFLSADTPEMLALNGGKPCWNYYRGGRSGLSTQQVNSIPKFRRHYVDSVAYKSKGSLDFGNPKEVFVKDVNVNDLVSDSKNIYMTRWKDYIGDLYNANTKVLKCKVNLKGLQVNDDLLGRFFWYDNCLWALNKISNHSITTEDLTECEFVSVNDIENYTNKQSKLYI